jgi:hypothetical protein
MRAVEAKCAESVSREKERHLGTSSNLPRCRSFHKGNHLTCGVTSNDKLVLLAPDLLKRRIDRVGQPPVSSGADNGQVPHSVSGKAQEERPECVIRQSSPVSPMPRGTSLRILSEKYTSPRRKQVMDIRMHAKSSRRTQQALLFPFSAERATFCQMNKSSRRTQQDLLFPFSAERGALSDQLCVLNAFAEQRSV